MPNDLLVILAKIIPWLPKDVQKIIHERISAMINQQYGH